MALSKKLQTFYDQVVDIYRDKGSFLDGDASLSIKTLAMFYEEIQKLQKQVRVFRQANSDLNRALREKNLCIGTLERRESSTLKDKSYDSWVKGTELQLDKLERICSDLRDVRRTRQFSTLWKIGAVLFLTGNGVCLGFVMHPYLFP